MGWGRRIKTRRSGQQWRGRGEKKQARGPGAQAAGLRSLTWSGTQWCWGICAERKEADTATKRRRRRKKPKAKEQMVTQRTHEVTQDDHRTRNGEAAMTRALDLKKQCLPLSEAVMVSRWVQGVDQSFPASLPWSLHMGKNHMVFLSCILWSVCPLQFDSQFSALL